MIVCIFCSPNANHILLTILTTTWSVPSTVKNAEMFENVFNTISSQWAMNMLTMSNKKESQIDIVTIKLKDGVREAFISILEMKTYSKLHIILEYAAKLTWNSDITLLQYMEIKHTTNAGT